MSTKGIKKRLRRAFDRLLYEPHPSPILVLGNQKTGTSAIAHLLADWAGLSKTIDVSEMREFLTPLMLGECDLASMAQKLPKPFSRELIKDPNLTFMLDDLRRIFPAGRYVFINRDPRENLRSFLSRMKIPGDLPELGDHADQIAKGWETVFDTKIWKTQSTHYVDKLADRWNRAADVYLENRKDQILIRYEDFRTDKLASIEALAHTLGLTQKGDISDKLDVQYQPRGTQVSPLEFFGAENLGRIERICGSRMREFDYV